MIQVGTVQSNSIRTNNTTNHQFFNDDISTLKSWSLSNNILIRYTLISINIKYKKGIGHFITNFLSMFDTHLYIHNIVDVYGCGGGPEGIT